VHADSDFTVTVGGGWCLMILGSSSQSFAKHDLNMQLDSGFHAVFGCWLHVFSEAEFRISVHEKSSLLAAEFRKSTDRSISSSIS
jgi:hypothetical protein